MSKRLKVVVFGPPGAGKTSLIRRFVVCVLFPRVLARNLRSLERNALNKQADEFDDDANIDEYVSNARGSAVNEARGFHLCERLFR